MPIAQAYSSAGQKKPPKASGPSQSDIFASNFTSILAGPQIKIFQYAIIPEISGGLPLVKDVTDFVKWARDPIAELKKEMQMDDRANVFSPKAGEYYASKLVTHSMAWGAKTVQVVSNLSKIGRGELPDTALVRSAMACEAAQLGDGYRRNPAKFLISKAWGLLAKGEILDNFIYDKQYIFHMADTKDGLRYARWRNNSLVEELNAKTAKYGQSLEGPELKFGASSYATRLSEKGKMVNGVFKESAWVPWAKGFKVAWQVLGPTAAVAAVFPPAWPAMLAWQVLNINYQEFKKRPEMVNVTEKQVEIWRNKRGYIDSTTSFTTPDGSRIVRDSKGYLQAMGYSPKHQYLDFMGDFFTVRGLYNTLVTGKSLRSRGWGGASDVLPKGTFSKFQDDWLKVSLWDGSKNVSGHLFNRTPIGLGMKHVGFNSLNNSYIYAQKIRAPFGLKIDGVDLGGKEITVKLFKDASGSWKHASDIFISAAKTGAVAQVWRAAYHIQQTLRNVGAPVALAVVFPNFVTIPLAGYSVLKYVSSITEPLKTFGWVSKQARYIDLISLSARGMLPKGMTLAMAKSLTLNGTRLLAWSEIQGNSWARKLARITFQIFNPFDREVGWLRRVAVWRERMWLHSQRDLSSIKNSTAGKAAGGFFRGLDKLLSRIPVLGFFYTVIKKIATRIFTALKKTPLVGFIVKGFGALVGLAKWVNSPLEAIQDFIKNLIKKGIRRVLKELFKKYVAKPLADLLSKWAAKLGNNSFAGRVLNFFSNGLKNLVRPGPSRLVRLQSFFNRITKFIKDIPQMIERFIKALVRFVKTLVRVIRTAVQTIKTAVQVIKSVISVFGNPVTWVILLIVIIIALIIFIAIMLWFLLSLMFGRFSSPPASGNLMVEKRVVTSQSHYNPGDQIDYSLRFKTLKTGLQDSIRIEDYFLVRGPDPSGSGTREYFDPASINCEGDYYNVESQYHVGGPSGEWYRAIQTSTDPITNVGVWYEIHCSARVAAGYTEGDLVNHAVVTGIISMTPLVTDSVSQYLYLNSQRPSGWPVEHGCFTQGPNGSFSHSGQQAIDIGNNNSLGFNIDGKPVHSTFNGVVQRICIAGTYNATAQYGVCGGSESGSYFGTEFGTYILVKDNTTGAVALYAHLLDPVLGLTVGQPVSSGDVIGYVDNTGTSTASHLHFAFTRASGLPMGPPNIPYYVPTCSGNPPDPTCVAAFTSLGDTSRVCF